MKLFNSKSQRIEQLQPLDGRVTLHVTGRVPMEEMEVGHLFPYCTADVLVRYLEMSELPVKYAYTINDASRFSQPGSHDLAEDRPPATERRSDFIEAMRALNLRPPDYFGEAADEPGMIGRFLGSEIDIHLESAPSPLPDGRQAAAQADSKSAPAPQARFELQAAPVGHAQPETNGLPEGAASVQALLQRFSGDALRIYLAQHHYRAPWTHDPLLLEKAAQHAERLSAAMNAKSTGETPINTVPAENRFAAALDNDLDTVKAIATLLNLADEILFRAPNDYRIDDAQVTLRQMATVFGLSLDKGSPEDRVLTGWHEYQKRIGLALEPTTVN